MPGGAPGAGGQGNLNASQAPRKRVPAPAGPASGPPAVGPSPGASRWPELGLPVSLVPGIGPARQERLAALGIHTVADLIRYLPRRHEDLSRLVPVADLRPPGPWTCVVTVLAREERRTGRVHLLRARLADPSGVVGAVWFNRPHLGRVLVPGTQVVLYGPVGEGRSGNLEFRAPEVEPVPRGSAPPQGGLRPVYPLGARWSQAALRAVVTRAVAAWAARIPETLPPAVLRGAGLIGAAQAWHDIHLPPSAAALEAARRRLVFEELLLLQLGLLLRRRQRAGAARGFRHLPAGTLSRRFREGLPFRLTGAQERVLAEIEADLAGPRPMYRLVQGDVGSGKTVVAAAAMLRAVEGGRQAALLAPTEILAEQHYLSLRRLCGRLCQVGLLTGSVPRPRRRELLAALADGRVDIVVGTHALLQPDVCFRALALAVTDEQQRFGVRQRDALAAKGACPDVLVMTATPIPRTLAMTLYGDLDVSVIDELPPGRVPVRTFQRPPSRRDAVYAFVRDQVAAGRQAFVVCPFISPRDSLEQAGADGGRWSPPEGSPPSGAADPAEAAETWAAALAQRLTGIRVGLLHGRMPLAAREETMAAVVAGDIQVLVATTVIEVGVDVPNATVLVVEGADRFGLAQLHQLRGRVGRGSHPAYCILVGRPGGRLEVLCRCRDGFVIAEEDLRQRGPGELLGTRQHGLPPLGLADPMQDGALLTQAREAAAGVLARDPGLSAPEHAALRAAVDAALLQPRG